MLHPQRVWREPRLVGDFEQLAALLCSQRWCLCTAFRVGSLTLLNDSASMDGPQEYAVLREGKLIDSIPMSWAGNPKRLAIYLQGLTWFAPAKAEPVKRAGQAPWQPQATAHYHHRHDCCRLCA